MPQQTIPVPQDDYGQSANTLFHFMKEQNFLSSALRNQALVPRYCVENIAYLNIRVDDNLVNEIAVLQKCFCDIPLHKLTETFNLTPVDSCVGALVSEGELRRNTHPDFYGEFAIAFSKQWGEKKTLQPIHYLNVDSSYTREFSALITEVLTVDDVPAYVADDVLARLTLAKPLRGTMERSIPKEKGSTTVVEFYKNFHDEQEWRFIPSPEALSKLQMEPLIANPYNIRRDILRSTNKSIMDEEYKSLWITFAYDEIRYIIVPHDQARIDMIHTIMQLPDEQFETNVDVSLQKHILISKILVLDEIRKDW